MDVLARLDQTRADFNVLEHPFYERWSAGELSAAELGCYAGEYRHAVLALAAASELAAEKAPEALAHGLRRHAEEERAHVDLWEDFAVAAGAPARSRERESEQVAGLAETHACAVAWTAGGELLEHLAVLYAIEAGQPEISRTKLEGLRAHYGHLAEGPASDYFAVHELRDVEHSGEARELIARLMSERGEDEELAERMVERAREALRGNWLLLDGVEAQAAA